MVAEEDWTAVVISAPTRIPMNRLAVSRSKTDFIPLPAAASRPELIICIPWRKRASPPNTPKNCNSSIIRPFCGKPPVI